MADSSSGRAWAVGVGVAAFGTATSATFTNLAAASWRRAADVAVLDPADALLVLVCVGGAALAGWLTLGAAATALEQVPGAFGVLARRVSARLAPALVRRTVALLAGTAVAAALAPGTAVAAPAPAAAASIAPIAPIASPAGDAGPDRAELPDPGFHPLTLPSAPSATQPAVPPTRPDRPEPGFRPAPPRTARPAVPIDSLGGPPRPGSVPEDAYVVRRGDTLWDIAARHLGPYATTAQIGAEWPRWYAANRALIGPNPDLIHPGQRLAPPASVGAR